MKTIATILECRRGFQPRCSRTVRNPSCRSLVYILFLGAFLLGGVSIAGADTADVDATYFHPAASQFIHGDSTSASNLVVNGLSQFPKDGKLLRLKELLEQQQEQEQNQEQSQDQEQEQDPQQDEPQDQNQDQDQPPDEAQQPEPPSAEQMSQDEAERLLDAMKQEEENKRLQLHPVMGRPIKVDKDW